MSKFFKLVTRSDSGIKITPDATEVLSKLQNPVHIFCFVGDTGSGKSHLARSLSPLFGINLPNIFPSAINALDLSCTVGVDCALLQQESKSVLILDCEGDAAIGEDSDIQTALIAIVCSLSSVLCYVDSSKTFQASAMNNIGKIIARILFTQTKLTWPTLHVILNMCNNVYDPEFLDKSLKTDKNKIQSYFKNRKLSIVPDEVDPGFKPSLKKLKESLETQLKPSSSNNKELSGLSILTALDTVIQSLNNYLNNKNNKGPASTFPKVSGFACLEKNVCERAMKIAKDSISKYQSYERNDCNLNALRQDTKNSISVFDYQVAGFITENDTCLASKTRKELQGYFDETTNCFAAEVRRKLLEFYDSRILQYTNYQSRNINITIRVGSSSKDVSLLISTYNPSFYQFKVCDHTMQLRNFQFLGHDGGCGPWETFAVERHPNWENNGGALALRTVAGHQPYASGHGGDVIKFDRNKIEEAEPVYFW